MNVFQKWVIGTCDEGRTSFCSHECLGEKPGMEKFEMIWNRMDDILRRHASGHEPFARRPRVVDHLALVLKSMQKAGEPRARAEESKFVFAKRPKLGIEK